MKIVFIGLGTMGLPMAVNLVKAGYDVHGFNRSDAKVAALVAAGGIAGGVLDSEVEDADVIITVLPDSPDVRAVLLGPDGIVGRLPEGSTVIDMSTVTPTLAVEVAQAAAAQRVSALDAPVSGGEAGAIEGSLSIMVGGEADVVEQRRGLLEAMGQTVVHVGGHGAGQTVKAANQLLVAATIQAVAEALTFLDASAVDLEPAVQVLAGGLAGNRILDRKSASMLAHDFRPGFRVELHHKDLGILLDAARRVRVPLPVGALVSQLMESSLARGDGALDHTALLRGVEQMAGRGR
ncbi:2-hydroxy-3-oxopropionate reductase [Microbacterium rhizosphaerae]|uniref:2-hydroxy-3-oxopropionate reductase n=1 Tax=Microbacterium rhizosphaerae TaxID=1678237 RepID=A0ABZ0SNL5_9MICO|nr:2-hydroxy-3-oxopropionate reductase [Microbacterium rhizosphaerae]WPR90075.1 2-hydroxy-3-oxopropionate reductase [Microbacterium rhizosphaerae]